MVYSIENSLEIDFTAHGGTIIVLSFTDYQNKASLLIVIKHVSYICYLQPARAKEGKELKASFSLKAKE